MRPSLVLALAGAGALVSAAGPRGRAPAAFPLGRRALMTCGETYGGGSARCGNSTSTMCYDPALGQSCCQDDGYCDRGSYCAPVAGYCCLDAETPEECARKAGFALPSNATGGPVTIVLTMTETATGGVRTGPVATISLAAPTGTAPAGRGFGGGASSNASSSGGGGGAWSPSDPPIQVSTAASRREQSPPRWTSVGAAVVGLLMSLR